MKPKQHKHSFLCSQGIHDYQPTAALNYWKCTRCDATQKRDPNNIWNNYEIVDGKIIHRPNPPTPIIHPHSEEDKE